ncbi:hypothetical protein CPB86DRAFT_818323 [Serendipita vermifera]|nr:hypothetical protein CPB86DRAFT_818323 [Serendipita vermifera]
MHNFFRQVLSCPPIFLAALGPAAVLAAQSTFYGIQQSAGLSALGELSRLSRAGMLITASAAQLSVNGFMNATLLVSPFKTSDHPESLCNHVIMESSTAVTVPVFPYTILAGFSLLIVGISYATSLDVARNMLFSSLRRYHDIWTLHLPGQLHKGITERLNGKDFKPIDVDAPWPNTPFASGPVVVTSNGVKKFGSGRPGSLDKVLEISNEHLLTEPFYASEHNHEP